MACSLDGRRRRQKVLCVRSARGRRDVVFGRHANSWSRAHPSIPRCSVLGFFHIENSVVIPIAPNAATLVYTVSAQRKGSEPYVALITSTYAHDQTWHLVVHQQTPTWQAA